MKKFLANVLDQFWEILIGIMMIPLVFLYFAFWWGYLLVGGFVQNIPFAIKRKLIGVTFEQEIREFIDNFRMIDEDGIEVRPIIESYEDTGYPFYQVNVGFTMCGEGENPETNRLYDGGVLVGTSQSVRNEDGSRTTRSYAGTLSCGKSHCLTNFYTNIPMESNKKDFINFLKVFRVGHKRSIERSRYFEEERDRQLFAEDQTDE